ncbi:M20 peptidase aminoacylase family protein [Fredinandcohnia onubensis]|uniref:M20 peptidase aminoacylase family protein n=1 Tax=Fredinandcohnia onubensis TaxID=1571209 RepID=UPI00211E1946|nr:M20 peptidase aminoacylase family protein [Fredinandcohnia onubensis]
MKIQQWVNEHEAYILETYKHFHGNPEISWHENLTKDYIIEQTKDYDFQIETFEEHPAVVLNWVGEEPGKTIALRADMDALWQKVNGEWQANHSCGHDAHMTMVLAAARCLREIGFKPKKGTVKFIFQPAEETGKGALTLVKEGALDNVDYLLGIHVRPKIEMDFNQASPAIYHGAATLIKGYIKGIQAHGARPNHGINVVDSLGAIIIAVNSIKVDPTTPSSVKVTQVNAGGSNINIIPDDAEFSIDIRSQTNEAMEELLQKLYTAIDYAGQANGAKVSYEIKAKMAAANRNQEMEDVIQSAIIEVLGDEGLVPPPVTPGGEDFHFFTTKLPKIKASMVGLGTDLQPGLHHPNMSFNLDALKNGTAILAISLLKLYEK